MAATYYGAMREPFANEDPSAPPTPSRCHNCNSTNLDCTPHRDLIDCVGRYGRLCGGEHLHWECRDCGADFTSPAAGECHE